MPLFSMYRRLPPLMRLVVQLASLVGILLILSAGLIVALEAKTSANRVTASCKFYRDVGTLPLDQRATATGINLVADARAAFIELRCKGNLPAPDPRVAAVLTDRPH